MKKKHYLARHGTYVDCRISILSGCFAHGSVERIHSRGILSYLMDHSAPPEGLGQEGGRALAELKDLLYRWDILRDGDLLGYVHQELQARGTRKKHGCYFTPRDIVDYIVSRCLAALPGILPGKILDPACGSGQFLIAAYAHISERQAKHKTAFEPPEDVLSRLYGFDSDPIAASICRWNLSRISGVNETEIRNIYNNNYLFNSISDGEISQVNDFDAVIGNPPWGSALSAVERRRAREIYASARSGVNSFTLFIERTLALLAPRGVMAFLLPEAYLNIGAHSESRRYVLEHMRILDIALWGERFKGVFAPAVSFIAERDDSSLPRERHIVRISGQPRRDPGRRHSFRRRIT
jgi:predicted RNA methylase